MERNKICTLLSHNIYNHHYYFHYHYHFGTCLVCHYVNDDRLNFDLDYRSVCVCEHDIDDNMLNWKLKIFRKFYHIKNQKSNLNLEQIIML